MSDLYVPRLPKIASETRNFVFDFTTFSELEAGETISSPSVPAVSGLTIGSPSVTTEDVIEDGHTVAAGKGVQVSIGGGTAGTSYTVNCTVSTSGGATIARRAIIRVY